MIVSSTERPPITNLGPCSTLPERYGSDIIIPIPNFGMVGVQRKDTKDLVASLRGDGRLSKEILQMKSLRLGVIVIEGKWKWGLDGQLLDSHTAFTKVHYRGLCFAFQQAGLWVLHSDTPQETCELVGQLELYLGKSKHSSLLRRPNPSGAWGNASSTEWGIHLMQGFSGIGSETAASIVDRFGGPPLQWRVTKQELMEVPGVGKGRAESLFAALNGTTLGE